MRVFFDTNIVLDQLDDHRAGHADLLELEIRLNQHKAVVLCSWHTLSIVEYVGAKTFGTTQIHKALRRLLHEYIVPETGSRHALEAFSYIEEDYEDALQIAAAVAGRADYLVTNDKSGFHLSPVPVVTPRELIDALATGA